MSLNNIDILNTCSIDYPCIGKINVFKFQPDVCNGCDDALIVSMNLNNIDILNTCSIDYPCIID